MSNPQNAPTAEERQRALAAVELRVQGLPYRRIAEQLGFADESGARRAVSRLLDRREAESVGELRAVHSERLEAVMAGHWPAALAGDTDAARIVLRALDSLAKLWGTNAPTRLAVGADDLSAEQFAEEAAQIIERITALGGPGELARSFPGAARHADGPAAVTETDLSNWSNIDGSVPEHQADDYSDVPTEVIAAAAEADSDAAAAAIIAAYREGKR